MQSDGCGKHKLIADVVVMSAGQVLLVRYRDSNRYDHQRGWFLPDDLLNHVEHPDTAAARILAEQLRLTTPAPRLSHIESFTGRDDTWHLVFHYLLALNDRPEIIPSEDIAAHAWFDPADLPPRRDVAHGGWAITTIDAALTRLATRG